MEILSGRAYRSASLYFRNKFPVITWETIPVEAIKLLVNNGTVEKITDNPFFFFLVRLSTSELFSCIGWEDTTGGRTKEGWWTCKHQFRI